jgi:hypothetical protein
MDHVDNWGVLCHECGATMFKGACLQYAPHLGPTIKRIFKSSPKLVGIFFTCSPSKRSH